MIMEGRSLLFDCDGNACCVAAVAFDAVVSAATGGGGTVGTPIVVPCTWILKALSTCSAAMLRLPETRMPAAPASTVPRGATRLALPTGESGLVWITAMPAPVTCDLASTVQ